MKRTGILAALFSAISIFSSFGCGTPAVGKLQTITLTSGGNAGLFEVKGEGGTFQLAATANYSSKSTVNVTNRVTYTVTATGTDLNGLALAATPKTLTVDAAGLVTAVPPFVCSFHNAEPDPTKPPSYVLTGSYQITATFDAVTSQPVFVGVASAAGDGPGSACGP
jgi:hypothetical protein